MIKITIPGNPVAKGRHRTTKRGITYTPKETRDFEELVGTIALQHRPKELITGAVVFEAFFYVPIPKSFSKKKRALALEGKIRPVAKPDLDNYAKIKDALNKIIFSDDSIIVEEHLYKFYSATPHAEMIIRELIL